ncbi:MAG TPA: serine hydrolase domain-containing protein, partial [Clostridia bacterium]|nr:serine hydrolase domain-containing protein [Clostridia bacterium]
PCANLEIGDRNGPVYRFSEGFCQTSPQKRPVDADTLFDMASVSKVMSVTMIALRFVEQGLLSLEDTMDRYYRDLPEASRGITVRLTHTGGIPGSTSIVGRPPERIDEEILALPPAYPKGTGVQYACLGFILLGRLLERVSGERLDSLAERLVFAPLGMERTGYAPKGDNIAATGGAPGLLGVVNDYNARYLGMPVGNAGVFSC